MKLLLVFIDSCSLMKCRTSNEWTNKKETTKIQINANKNNVLLFQWCCYTGIDNMLFIAWPSTMCLYIIFFLFVRTPTEFLINIDRLMVWVYRLYYTVIVRFLCTQTCSNTWATIALKSLTVIVCGFRTLLLSIARFCYIHKQPRHNTHLKWLILWSHTNINRADKLKSTWIFRSLRFDS